MGPDWLRWWLMLEDGARWGRMVTDDHDGLRYIQMLEGWDYDGLRWWQMVCLLGKMGHMPVDGHRWVGMVIDYVRWAFKLGRLAQIPVDGSRCVEMVVDYFRWAVQLVRY